MAVTIKTAGFNQVITSLRNRRNKVKPFTNLVVGYGASYATRIHEDLQMFHTNGQAKFLEQPARTLQVNIGNIVHQELLYGKTMTEALTLAGMYLLQESQKLVPVRSGFLRDSGFVDVR